MSIVVTLSTHENVRINKDSCNEFTDNSKAKEWIHHLVESHSVGTPDENEAIINAAMEGDTNERFPDYTMDVMHGEILYALEYDYNSLETRYVSDSNQGTNNIDAATSYSLLEAIEEVNKSEGNCQMVKFIVNPNTFNRTIIND